MSSDVLINVSNNYKKHVANNNNTHVKAEAHRHKENRLADRKRTNQNILPIRKNLMLYSLSESANKSVDFAPFWKRNRNFTWIRSLVIWPALTSRRAVFRFSRWPMDHGPLHRRVAAPPQGKLGQHDRNKTLKYIFSQHLKCCFNNDITVFFYVF